MMPAGADIVRVAVPHEGDAKALPIIAKEGGVPIIADIHFSVRLALMAIEAGVHAWAARDGQYRPVTTWRLRDDGALVDVIREA